MFTTFYSSVVPHNRHEERIAKRHFVEVKLIGEKESEGIEAIITDMSNSGISLVSNLPIPVGTRVEVVSAGDVYATGEVINIDSWDCYDLVRMGIRFIEKND